MGYCKADAGRCSAGSPPHLRPYPYAYSCRAAGTRPATCVSTPEGRGGGGQRADPRCLQGCSPAPALPPCPQLRPRLRPVLLHSLTPCLPARLPACRGPGPCLPYRCACLGACWACRLQRLPALQPLCRQLLLAAWRAGLLCSHIVTSTAAACPPPTRTGQKQDVSVFRLIAAGEPPALLPGCERSGSVEAAGGTVTALLPPLASFPQPPTHQAPWRRASTAARSTSSSTVT